VVGDTYIPKNYIINKEGWQEKDRVKEAKRKQTRNTEKGLAVL